MGSLFRGQVTEIRREINEFFDKHDLQNNEETKDEIMRTIEYYSKANRRIRKSIERFLKNYFNKENGEKTKGKMARPSGNVDSTDEDDELELFHTPVIIPNKMGIRRMAKPVEKDYRKC